MAKGRGPKPKFKFELDPETEKTVRKAAVDLAHDLADKVFAESQDLIPVDRGTLKKSGNVEYKDWGATVSYNAAYASAVHEGSRPNMPPVEPIIAWTRRKFHLSDSEARSAGWAVAMKIKKEGTEGVDFLKQAVERGKAWLAANGPQFIRERIRFRFKMGGKR